MKLIDLEPKTDLIIKAIDEGIKTTDEYNIWLLGYTAGIREARTLVSEYISKDKK